MELTDELIDEEADGNDIEDKEVEDVLPIFFQKVCPDVPLFQHPMTTSFSDGFQSKTLHPTTKKRLTQSSRLKIGPRGAYNHI